MKQAIIYSLFFSALSALVGCGTGTVESGTILGLESSNTAQQLSSSQTQLSSSQPPTITPSSQETTPTTSSNQDTSISSHDQASVSSSLETTPSSTINQSSAGASSSVHTPLSSSSVDVRFEGSDRVNKFIDGSIEYAYGTRDTPDSTKTVDGAGLLKDNHYFDTQGTRIRWEEYDPTGTYFYRIQEYTNDAVTKITQYLGPDSLDYIQNSDTNEQPIDLTKYENNKKKTLQYYDSLGQITSQIQFNVLEVKSTEINYANGVKSESIAYQADAITRKTYSTYDTQEVITQQTTYQADGSTLKTVSNFTPNSSVKGYQMTQQFKYNSDGTIDVEFYFHADGWEEKQVQYKYGTNKKVTIFLNAAGDTLGREEVGL
ncbi:MAG: hypothetical protein OCD01_10920 [Fibrobacterales bacterium]